MADPTFINILISLIFLPLQLVNFIMTGVLEFIFLDLFNLGSAMTM